MQNSTSHRGVVRLLDGKSYTGTMRIDGHIVHLRGFRRVRNWDRWEEGAYVDRIWPLRQVAAIDLEYEPAF
jgi:hypothetical protein